jgi:hypothetical protein
MNSRILVFCLPCFILGSLLSSSAQARPRFYAEPQTIKGLSAPDCDLDETALRQQLLKSLDARPEITTSFPGTKPESPKKLKRLLRRKRLKGYAFSLRLVTCKHSVLPPEPGKTYKRLFTEVSVALEGETIPAGQMAIAGTGSAKVGVEISRLKATERKQLYGEALEAALSQAVGQTIGKLSGGKKTKRRRAKRRRRRKAKSSK